MEFAQLANDRCEVKEGGERRLHSRRRTPQHLAHRGLKKKPRHFDWLRSSDLPSPPGGTKDAVMMSMSAQFITI